MNHKFRDRPCAGWAHDAGPGSALRLGTRRMQRVAVGLGWGLCWAMALPAAQAATITVNSTAGEQIAGNGQCTIQEAFANVNERADVSSGDCAAADGVNDTITLGERQTYVLTGPMAGEDGASAITIRQSVSVDGRGSVIEAGTEVSNLRMVLVRAGTAQLENMTLRKGSVNGDGGGILVVENASLSVSKVTVSGNAATDSGGGIANLGTVTVDRSTLSGNRASRGGGLLTFGSALIRNSTVSGNAAQVGFIASGSCGLGGGGGIASCSGSRLTLTDSTVTRNNAGAGGGISVAGTVVLRRNLISGNTATTNRRGDEAITSAGGTYEFSHNVFGHSGVNTATGFAGFGARETDLTLFADGNRPTALSQLMTPVLADNGGPTETHALIAGSPALDITAIDCPAVDQRGVSRPVGAGCDAGAFEGSLAGTRIVVNSTADQIVAGDGACTLKEAVSNANALRDTTNGDCTAGFNPTIVLGERQRYTMTTAMAGDCCSALIFTHSVRVEGHGSTIARDPTLSSELRLLLAQSSIEGEIAIEDLTISGGRATGGGIFVQSGASLRLNRCTVRDNTAGSGRLGGGLRNLGNTTIENSTFTGNSGGGAAVHSSEGTTSHNVVIVNSTFSGNTGDYLAEDGVTMIHEPGGAIALVGRSEGALTVLSSTVTNNSATLGGGGLYLRNGETIRGNSSPRVALGRNIIAGNRSLSAGSELLSVSSGDRRAAIFTLDRNLFGDSSEASAQSVARFALSGFIAVPFTVGPTDITAYADGTRPTALAGILNPALADNGGFTLTHALVRGSPAVDSGGDCPMVDQRGAARPVDSDDDGTPTCDIGAVEARVADLSISASATPARIVAGTGTSVRFVIDNAGPDASSGARLKVDLPAGLSVSDSRTTLTGAACTSASVTELTCTLGDLANQVSGDIVLDLLSDAGLSTGMLQVTGTLLPGADFDLDSRLDSVSTTITVDARDATPDAFSFTSRNDVARNAVIASDAAMLSGTTIPAAISVTGGEYSIGCADGSYTAVAGSIDPGATVCVRQTSATGFGTDTVTTLTIGGVSGTFTSTTLARDITPEAFGFNSVSGVARNALQTSNAVRIGSINDASPYSVTSGLAAINDGPCTSSTGTVSAGDRLRVCHVSSAQGATAVTTTLTVGADGVLAGVSADFTSTTVAAPVLSVTPTSLRFGNQRVGTTSGAKTIALSNSGGDTLVIGGIRIAGPFERDGGTCGSSLPAGTSCTLGIRYRPTAAGSVSGSAAISSDGGSASVVLSGTGIAPALSLSQRSLSFGRAGVIRFGELRIGQTSQPQTITATNTGSAPLSISSIRTTGDFVQSTTCGKTLAVNASCTISLRFKPSTPGDRSGETLITSDALTSPDRITLGGRGIGVAVKR